MKYYSHHIGDFDRTTRHLSRLERSIYRDLLDVYYDTEQQLTLDMPALCRRVIARTNEEATAVEQVLNEFFTKTPTGWYHVDCEAGIEAYRASTSQKSAAGKASAAKKAAALQQAINGKSTPVEQTLNGCSTALQLTINHKPLTTKNKTLSDQSPDVPEVERPAKHRHSPEDESIACQIFGMILNGNASAKRPNIDMWSEDVRKMREIDRRTHADMLSLFEWVRKDAFWRPNVLSPAKLREKWDQLTEKRNQGNQARASPINEKFNFAHLDRSGDIRAAEESARRHGITALENEMDHEL